MPGLFTRITHWKGKKSVLTKTALNNEFDNVITNSIPTMIDDLSLDVTAMQETSSPGDVGSEIQAQSFEAEIQKIRYMVKAITGESQWYSAPDSTLTLLKSAFSVPTRRVLEGAVNSFGQPMFLQGHASLLRVTMLAQQTSLVGFINDGLAILDDDLLLSTLTAAPSTNNTALVNVSGLAGETYSKYLGEGDLGLPIDNIGSELVVRNGKKAAFKVTHGGSTEYFIAEIDTTLSILKNAYRGFFFDADLANVPRLAIHNNDPITLLNLAYVFVNDTTPRALEVTYDEPVVSYDQPSTADYWFDLSTSQWKKKVSGVFTAANLLYLGMAVTDTTKCIATRSTDFFRAFDSDNDVQIARVDVDEAKVRANGSRVSSYGTLFRLSENDTWKMDLGLDTGVTEAASTTYFFYLTQDGDKVISDVAPHDRYHDLQGAYHPAKPWRCLGSVFNDGSSDFNDQCDSEYRGQSGEALQVHNFGFRSVVSGANHVLTLATPSGADPSAVCPVVVNFPADAGVTAYTIQKRFEAPLITTVTKDLGPNSITSGTLTAPMTVDLHLAHLNNRLLFVYNSSISKALPNNYLAKQTISAESWNVVKAGAFYTDDTSPTFHPGDRGGFDGPVYLVTGAAGATHGSVRTKIRRWADSNTFFITDQKGYLAKVESDSSNGTVIYILRSGIWEIGYEDARAGGVAVVALATDISNSTNYFTGTSGKLVGAQPAAGQTVLVRYVGYLAAEQKVYPQSDGNNDLATARLYLSFLGEA